MELGIFGVGDRHPNVETGRTPTEHECIRGMARIARHAEDVGLDVYALGEHHNPPFIPIDMAGISEQTVHEQLDLIGTDVLPAMRREFESRAAV